VTVSLRAALLDWQTDKLSMFGLCVELALAAAYVAFGRRARRSGRSWSSWRTTAFVAGLLVLALSLQSGFGRYDEIFWVHIVQHQLLMSLAPALLMLGAPLVLVLRVLPTDKARRLVGVLHHRLLNWMNGPAAAIHLPLHYYGVMYLYLLTPAYALGQRNALFHDFVHVYFIGCGLMFWLPVLGRYPSRWHPAYRTKIRMLAIGLPINLLLAGIIAARSPISSIAGPETMAGVWALVVGSAFCTALGLLLVRAARRPARKAVRLGTSSVAAVPVLAMNRRA
jgi:putative membrane protein